MIYCLEFIYPITPFVGVSATLIDTLMLTLFTDHYIRMISLKIKFTEIIGKKLCVSRSTKTDVFIFKKRK